MKAPPTQACAVSSSALPAVGGSAVDEAGEEHDVFSETQLSLLLSQMMQAKLEVSPHPSSSAVDTRRSRHFSGASHVEAPPTESAEMRETSSDESMLSGARGKRAGSVIIRGSACCAAQSDDSNVAAAVGPASRSDAAPFNLLEQLTATRAKADGLSLAHDSALLDALNYGARDEARQRSAAWFGARASMVMPPLQSAGVEPSRAVAAPGSLSALLDEARGHYDRSQRARRMVECASHAAAGGPLVPQTSASASGASSTAEELTTLRALVTSLQARCSMTVQDSMRAAANTSFLRERLDLLLDAAVAASAPDLPAEAQTSAVAALRDLAAKTRAQLGADGGKRLRDELRTQMAGVERAVADMQRTTAAAAAREDELRAQLLQERADRRRADNAVMTSEATTDRIRRSRQSARDECDRYRQQCEALKRELGRVRAASLANASESSPHSRVMPLTGTPATAMCDSLTAAVSPATTVAVVGPAFSVSAAGGAGHDRSAAAELLASDVASASPSPAGPRTAVVPNPPGQYEGAAGGGGQSLARFAPVEAPRCASGSTDMPAPRADRSRTQRDAPNATVHAPRAPSACEDEVQATVVVATPIVRRDRAVDHGKLLSSHAATLTSLHTATIISGSANYSSPISDARSDSPNHLSRSMTTSSHTGAAFARSNTTVSTARRYEMLAISHAAEPTAHQHADPRSAHGAAAAHNAAAAPQPTRQSFFADPAQHGRRQSFTIATASRRGPTSCAVGPRIDTGAAFRRSETTPLCAVNGIGGANVYRASPLAATTTSGISPFATVNMPPQRRVSVVATRLSSK